MTMFYTIVDSSEYIDGSGFTWGNLFEALDSKVGHLGYSIRSGRYVSEDPYKSDRDSEYVSLSATRRDAGQLIELTRNWEYGL